jgi:hypothetical protein
MSAEYFNAKNVFVERLYLMLNDPRHTESLCWSEDGKSFIIKEKSSLESKVLGLYFKSSNYSKYLYCLNILSFCLKLNAYEFKRMNEDLGRTEYFHPCFVKVASTFNVFREEPIFIPLSRQTTLETHLLLPPQSRKAPRPKFQRTRISSVLIKSSTI